ncbi:MAG TPA: tetratricopeptide repeat protein [Kofleriaceae bacterium]|nr:tetratricopeptide repeat protein [Kofleriaceae bacterium]
MPLDEGSRRWERIERPDGDDPLQALRAAIAAVRAAPRDLEARRRLRAFAAEHGMWDELALLLADEARAADRGELAAAFYEELADVHENLDQSLETIAAMEQVVRLEPDDVSHHDRLAWLYRRAGAWAKAAAEFERVGDLSHDERGRAALRAAGKLFRDHGKLDRAATVYRTIVTRRPTDDDAWRALDEILAQLGQWREVAEVRAERAFRAKTSLDKAALLRSRARALEQAGDVPAAAGAVAEASTHAPDDISGLVDYADVLARSGQGREAASILATRVADAIERGAAADDIAALRLRLANILDEACADRAAATAVLDELLAAAPGYLPALERITAIAAQDANPSAHAEALLRYAAALPQPDVGVLVAAARRFREAGDHRSATRVFADAAALVPEDAALRQELDESRATVMVQTAADEVAAGETANAESLLRSILAAQPHHRGAHLALVELLVKTERLEAASEHLHDTLAAAPSSTPPAQLAALVHKLATVRSALGDADESHQLLHEAHRLDRGDLTIRLALGESCFARRLWREAARHLGALATHPDAAAHAPVVAAALVKAAQAETRALRPANATAHYEAAVKLDPRSAPAWHALAEIAMERGDLARAADCLEQEASATTDPRDRLRLYDALGDMAEDVLGDPERAERCWSEVADAGYAPVLEKLLVVQRKRGATVERAETCEWLAELREDPRAKQELAIEAAQAFAEAGELGRAREHADRMMAKHAPDIEAVVCATAISALLGDAMRTATWLRRVLAVWDGTDEATEPAVAAGDPRHAELWRRLGDAERTLGNGDAALQAYRRAIAIAPDSDGAHAARRGVVELASVLEPSTSDAALESSLFALVEADHEPADAIAWARQLARGGRFLDSLAAYELARALGAPLSDDDVQFISDHPQRLLAADEPYGAPLDEQDRRDLIEDPDDAPLGPVLDLLGEAAALVCPPAAAALSASALPAQRLAPTNGALAAALYPQIAKAFGAPPALLHTIADGPDVTLLLAAPPVVVLGPGLLATTGPDIELRYWLGRAVELVRPRRLFAIGQSPEAFARLVASLRAVASGEPDELRGKLSVSLRKRIADAIAAAGDAAFDPDRYRAACERAADRTGLLACGDIATAIRLAGGAAAAPHLVALATKPSYLAARRKLRSFAAATS